MEQIFQQSFPVRLFEIGLGGRMRADALLGVIMDVAHLHTVVCRFDVGTLLAQGKTWFLSRSRLQVLRWPVLNEIIQVRTWLADQCPQFAMRDGEVRDVENKVIARSTGDWRLLDVMQCRAISPLTVVDQAYATGRRSIAEPFPDIPPITGTCHEVLLPVQYRDVGINGYAVNYVYPMLAFEAISISLRRQLTLSDLKTSILKEAHLGDVIRSRLMPLTMTDSETSFLHQLINKKTGQELSRIVSHWRR